MSRFLGQERVVYERRTTRREKSGCGLEDETAEVVNMSTDRVFSH
jgi:hypothetical protein